jgi:glutathionyl-hydroquinone reductase
MAQTLSFNTLFDWGSITLVVKGVPLIGITKIEYKQTQDKKNNWGFGRDVIGRGYGNIDYSGSIEVYIEEWNKFINSVSTGNPLDIAPFDITVQYRTKGAVVTKDILYGCEFLENPFTSNQGDTSIKVTVPIIFNGLDRGL